jgi:hypothetical protein
MKPPIPVQPKDQEDEVYKLVQNYLQPGDRKAIAEKLNVSISAVGQVCRGKDHSKRIWEAIITQVVKRKDQNDAFLKYMSK